MIEKGVETNLTWYDISITNKKGFDRHQQSFHEEA